MQNFKSKVCLLCFTDFFPTSPKQKYCEKCREEGRKIADRKRDLSRHRKKFNYNEFDRVCLCCGVEFKTYYSKKVYCGLEVCDKDRISRKNHVIHLRRNKEELLLKGRKYYSSNKEKCCLSKANGYRKLNPKAKEYISGRISRHNINFVKEYVDSQNYTLVSKEYTNNRDDIVLICPHNHTWTTSFHNFKDGGARCFYCYINNNYTSKFELSVRDFINEIYSGPIIYNDRTMITSTLTKKNLELDIYFPELNKAIECNGIYWHSTEQAIVRDTIKIDQCINSNIELLTITDEEWFCGDGKELIMYFLDKLIYF